MASSTEQHPREFIRDALEARQQMGENPLKGFHMCFIMMSFVAAIFTLIYEYNFLIKGDSTKDPNHKWLKRNKHSSVRYINNTNDIKGFNDYDYIIIGAGTAGSALALKLATDITYPRVLVIESKSIHVLFQQKQNKVTAFKDIESIDQISVQSNNNNDFWISSSAKTHDNNIWSIGAPKDYDNLWNISGWNWNDVLPYFIQTEKVIIDEIVHELGVKMEKKAKVKASAASRTQKLVERAISMMPIGPDRDHFSDKQFKYEDRNISQNRGMYGNVLVKQARKYSMVNAFIVNAINAGYEYNVDHNTAYDYNANTENKLVNTVSYQQYKKYPIFESYIQRLRGSTFAKKNAQLVLDVLFDTQVTQILFQDIQKSHGKHVGIGVELINNSTKYEIYLRDVNDYQRSNEIILSAGAIESPKLLMKSGFGDTQYLKQCCDINVIEHNAEIGQNLEDQIKFSIYFRHNPEYKVLSKEEIAQVKYQILGGTMVNASGYDANIFYNPYASDIPLLQFVFYNGIRPIGVNNVHNVSCTKTEALEGVSVDIILLHPKSRGFIQLQSDDALYVNPKYLSDAENEDLELLLKGYQEIERILFNKEPFVGETTFGHFWPCGEMKEVNDDTMKQYIRNNIQSSHNYLGTNKMGIVVDDKLVLNNTMNIRVVDASVVPASISGSIQAPIVMMAEKAADIILNKAEREQNINETETNTEVDEDDFPRHSEL